MINPLAFAANLLCGSTEVPADPDLVVLEAGFTAEHPERLCVGALQTSHDVVLPVADNFARKRLARGGRRYDLASDLEQIAQQLGTVRVPQPPRMSSMRADAGPTASPPFTRAPWAGSCSTAASARMAASIEASPVGSLA